MPGSRSSALASGTAPTFGAAPVGVAGGLHTALDLDTVLDVDERTALSVAIDAALDEAARQVREDVSQSELAGNPLAEDLGWTFPGRGNRGVYVEGVREQAEGRRLTVRLTAYAEPGLFRRQVQRERVVVVNLDDS